MRRKIPTTAALAAFEAAARHLSFTRAAAELAVTQSAICRQVATLEAFLGVKLFRRSQRGVSLTDAGQRYARRVAARLDEVERDTLDLITTARAPAGSAEVAGTLELAVVPTFATQWLLPRLPDFAARYPGVVLHFTPRTRPFLFADTVFDAAILPLPGDGLWPGTEGRCLLEEALIPVAAPRWVQARFGAGREQLTPEEVATLPLLQASTRPYAWRQWFASLGLEVAHDMAGPRMELFSMLSEAAAQGLGVALVPSLLVERELASGRLVRLLDHRFVSDRRYFLLYPPHKAEGEVLAALAGWLVSHAQNTSGAWLKSLNDV